MNKYVNGNLIIDLEQVIDNMESEDKRKVLKSLAVSSDVVEWVLDYITGNDPDGWYDGCEQDTRQKFLEKVEDTQLGQSWLSCYWKPWDELRDRLKLIEAQRETYRRIHAMRRDDYAPCSAFLRETFDVDECSHYVTKEADEKIKEIEDLVVKTLNSMRKEKGDA